MTISAKLKPLAVSYAIVASVGCGSKGTISPKVPSQQHAVKKINTGQDSPEDQLGPTTVAKTGEGLSQGTASQHTSGALGPIIDPGPCSIIIRHPFGEYFDPEDFLAGLWDCYHTRGEGKTKFRRGRGRKDDSISARIGADYLADGGKIWKRSNRFSIVLATLFLAADKCKSDEVEEVLNIRVHKDTWLLSCRNELKKQKAYWMRIMLYAIYKTTEGATSKGDLFAKTQENGTTKLLLQCLHVDPIIEIMDKLMTTEVVKAVIEALDDEIKKPRGDDPEDKDTSLIGTPYDGGKVQEIRGINRKPERKGTPYKIEDFIGKLTKEEEKKYWQVIGKASFVRYTRSSTQGP